MKHVLNFPASTRIEFNSHVHQRNASEGENITSLRGEKCQKQPSSELCSAEAGKLADRQGQDCHVGNDIRDRDAGKPYAFINACTLCGGHAPSLPDGPTLEYGEETDRDPPHENDNTKRVSTNLHGS
ncbi:hypothetical protein FOXG_22002 [Fusarium oxysporum f. sp. lycopersici 4287]|uniref:Uncharacterized protein n=1 Tax=Fusarium oxysporum f. sp. lycopersici (strain 4287 / CBS 123668 / FGSC 9935 / NRRL 34936) TaxID=426428 RepID=A0A0J9W3M2_FUSO4|nr:hypothetical protein FOXG_22002 [Fusarium oxysporum f. sp. lycopersici 4287]KNB17664.1 hypothetical protein FOXG_22002 [Fusarium oxysporum f. sp. lycopersici 4287]